MPLDYDEASKTYDQYRSFNDSLVKNIIDFGEISKATRVLDLGCGTGNAASKLGGLIKADIIGLDRSIPMLKIARSKSVEVLAADADKHRLPFRDRSFDTVISTYVIHQMENPGHLFSELHRILAKGKLVLLTSSHQQIEHQHPIIKEFFPSFIDLDKGRFPDTHEIDKLLESSGFINIEHKDILGEEIPIDHGYLQKVKGKSVSTYHLLPPGEFERGVEKLEKYINNLSRPEFREWRGTLIRADKTAD